MNLKSANFKAGDGSSQVQLYATFTGRGINILLTGGKSPHIGGMVMAMPRTSLGGSGISSDAWVVPVAGHKDVEALKEMAERVARITGQVTVVTGGMHIPEADIWLIELLLKNSRQVADQLVNYCQVNGILQQC